MKLFQLRAKASEKQRCCSSIKTFTIPPPPLFKDRAQSITSRCFSLWLVLFFLIPWSVILPVTVSAQNSCPGGSIASSGHITCVVSQGTSGDVVIDQTDRVISTTVLNIAPGINVSRLSEGNINISLTGGSITTEGVLSAHGIRGNHKVKGNNSITVSGGSIATKGTNSHGIFAFHETNESEGNIVISVLEEATITTGGTALTALANGIYGRHEGVGDIGITVSGGSITTESRVSIGILGQHRGAGNLAVSVSGGSITTKELNSYGIYGQHSGTGNVGITFSGGKITAEGMVAHGIRSQHSGTGDIGITVSGGSITTKGESSHGINAVHKSSGSTGNITISVLEKATITTELAGAHGIYVHHQGTQATQTDTDAATHKKIAVDLSGGSITTKGEDAYGISVWHEHPGEGKVSIATRDGHTITTEGANAHGIHIEHAGIGSSEIVVANITAEGVGAYGVRFGRLNDEDEIERVVAFMVDDDGTRQLLDAEGYRPQMVRINGTVMGGQASEEEDGTDGAGVFMAGGGQVTIGPEGVLGAESGITIHAVGDNRTDQDDEEPPRKLYVNLESMDGKPWERLAGRIVNEDGETILAVNGTDVFDNGRIDAWAPFGSLQELSLNPDEDFSSLDFSDEEDWVRRYQAHVGAYEALPGALRRIDTIACHVPTQQNYIGVCGGRGQYTPDQTTTGMSYAYDQQALHSHIMRPLSEQVSGWAGLRQVSGEANVNIAAGSSRVTVRGVGVHGGVQVMGDTDLYGQAHLQWTRYTLNLVSGAVRGTTKGTSWSLGLEGGRHFRVDDETRVTGRGWLKHANVSVNPFEDSVGLRVSGQERQVIAGVGVRGERTMVQENEDRRVVLRGSAGIETAVSEASTVMVGDEVLSSQAKATRLLLDVGGVLHQGDTEFHGMVYAHGLGADDTAYGLRLGLEWSF